MPRKNAFGASFGSGFGPSYKRSTLIIKVGNVGADPQWRDGDILNAINWHRTRCVHVEHICSPKRMLGGKGVRRPVGQIGQIAFLDTVKQYRFEVLNTTQVKRITLADDTEEVFPLDTEAFIARRLKHPRHMIFGDAGSETFYGGSTDAAESKLDAAWDVVEANTGHREEDFDFWPCGVLDLQHHLVLHGTDLRDSDSVEFEERDEDLTDPEDPILVKKRKRTFPWRDVNGMASSVITQVEDRNQSVDLRAVKHPPKLYVGDK